MRTLPNPPYDTLCVTIDFLYLHNVVGKVEATFMVEAQDVDLNVCMVLQTANRSKCFSGQIVELYTFIGILEILFNSSNFLVIRKRIVSRMICEAIAYKFAAQARPWSTGM